MAQEAILRCHCGQLTEKVRLRDDIPVGGLLCHCNACRHVTGALTFSGIALTNPPTDVFTTKLTKYATSNKIDRYFCSTCGSHVCYYSYKDSHWHACSGCVDEVLDGYEGSLEKYDAHEFVGDTTDGGLAFTIPGVPMWLEGDERTRVDNMWEEMVRIKKSAPSTAGHEKVQAECHCGRVSFSILRSKDGGKFDAEICPCRSCRLSVGQPLVPYILRVPYNRVIWKDGTVHDGSIHESVTKFQSSEGAHREFCPTCGATIFYDMAERVGLIDIALGIVRPQDGVLAKTFVQWNTDNIDFMEDAFDKGLLAYVKRNLKVVDKQ